MNRLRITEIFFSLQGETRTVGLPTVFIRLTGCPLRCQYCDTAYAFEGGEYVEISAILKKVEQYNPSYVTVTGGEPLAQPLCHDLLSALCDKGYEVSLETSGAISLSEVDERVIKVMDIKTPGSLEEEKNKWDNLSHILPHDQIKFVICNEADYQWAKSAIEKYKLNYLCEVLFSPSHGEMSNNVLADWILRDKLKVRFQMQMHKFIWGDIPGK